MRTMIDYMCTISISGAKKRLQIARRDGYVGLLGDSVLTGFNPTRRYAGVHVPSRLPSQFQVWRSAQRQPLARALAAAEMHRAHFDYDATRALRLGRATPAEKRMYARARLDQFRCAKLPSPSMAACLACHRAKQLQRGTVSALLSPITCSCPRLCHAQFTMAGGRLPREVEQRGQALEAIALAVRREPDAAGVGRGAGPSSHPAALAIPWTAKPH